MDKNITITLTVDQLQILSDLVGKEIIDLHNEEAPNTPMRISSKVGLCWDGMSEKAIGMNTLWEVIAKAKISAELDAEAEAQEALAEDIRWIQTEEEAMEAIRRIAETYPVYRDMDLDALWKVGEADTKTIFNGYLWHEVEFLFLGMPEDTNTLLADAIVKYFVDQMDIED